MVILQATGMRSSKYGGMERFFVELSKQLQTRGDKLYIAYNSEPSSREYIYNLTRNGAEITVTNLNPPTIYEAFCNFRRVLKEIKPDIVHLHFGIISDKLFYLPWLSGVKKTCRTIHSMQFPNSHITIRSKLKFKLMTKLCAITTVSDAIQREIMSATGYSSENYRTFYLGVKEPETGGIINRATNKTIITSTAFHDEVKGIDILLKAVSILKNRYKRNDFECWQIGGGRAEYTEYLKAECKRLDIEEHVQWLGIRNDVYSLLQASDIYVQPSRSEGISLSLMEASLCRLPLVGSNTGGITEVIKEERNGYTFTVEDSDKLAQILETLCNDESLRKRLGNESYNIAKKKFDIKNNTRHFIEELY